MQHGKQQWNEAQSGAISLAAIRSLYPPHNQNLIRSATYEVGVHFTGISFPHRLYVIEGACQLTISDTAWTLDKGDFLDCPEGNYELQVLGSSALTIVSAWEVPEEFPM